MSDSSPGLALSTSPRSDVIGRAELTRRDRDAMFALYTSYFATSDRIAFERDLAEKEWVVLLRDEHGVIDGFSTLMRFEIDGATIFYSGDTIVARHRWGTFDLPRTWSRYVFAHAGENAYWFLISSGFRTYRYLPLFFRNFYPRDASLKPLLDAIASEKFGDAYDARTGVIRLATPAPLREGISDPELRLSNPHVRFFLEANPGHADGDELACLVPIDVANLTPAGLRMIGRR
ncbi:MAG TPA: hypothetical protein VEK11_03130 [Thermoanaerobaculia bacterium]|nr:hypothetical protein [Thermoanaerobaculia bacterium]